MPAITPVVVTVVIWVTGVTVVTGATKIPKVRGENEGKENPPVMSSESKSDKNCMMSGKKVKEGSQLNRLPINQETKPNKKPRQRLISANRRDLGKVSPNRSGVQIATATPRCGGSRDHFVGYSGRLIDFIETNSNNRGKIETRRHAIAATNQFRLGVIKS